MDYNMKIADNLIKELRLANPVYVTRPTMPSLKKFTKGLGEIWHTRWLTNNGRFHRKLEQELCTYLKIRYCSLFNNGTIGLMVGIHALRLSGEIITTPFTFPATPNVLYWNGITPVFCDIEDKTLNINPNKIEELITPKTSAILAVHVYGNPCDIDKIEAIGKRHGLRIIYDAAHAFGVEFRRKSLCYYGDLSMLSFHATKLFSTMEGGALVTRDHSLKERIDYLKNFGIVDEDTIVMPGINGKMNEVQSLFGILHLKIVNKEIARRKAIAQTYRANLTKIEGIKFLDDLPYVQHNYAYFPILVDKDKFGMSRDDLYLILRKFNIYTRKYFYPLCSHYPFFRSLPSANPKLLTTAERVAREVLCLPIYGTLDLEIARKIAYIIFSLWQFLKI